MKKEKLISLTDKLVSFAFGDKTDAQYDYEQALYHNMLGEATDDELQQMADFEQNHPVDAVDSRNELANLYEKRKGKLNCFDELRFVKPNRNVGKDIFGNFFTGSYEHKDENGNWVPGPALGHGYEGGYDYSWSPDECVEKIKRKIASAFEDPESIPNG